MATMFGPYRLDRLLGRGGMGEVHEAYDTAHERAVALKLLPEALTADEEYRARFRREAKITATLHEPHVIPIHSYGEIDGRLFLDMRLVVGEDLSAVLARTGGLGAARAVAVVEQVAAALDAAHAGGLVHRDVKPSNVLVTTVPPGRPDFCYLVDFGIARSTSSGTRSRLTATGATIGTLEYMAPERFTDGPVDHRADVYALGCVLHECLTGRPPFTGGSLPSLLNAHLNQPPPRPSAQVAGVGALDAVVARAMAKRPEERYTSAGELAAAARAALSPAPVTEVLPERTAPVPPVRPRTDPTSVRPAPATPPRPRTDAGAPAPHVGARSYPAPTPHVPARVYPPPPPPMPAGRARPRRGAVLAAAAAVVVLASVTGGVVLLGGTTTSQGTPTTSTSPTASPPSTTTTVPAATSTATVPAASGPVQAVLADAGPNEPFSGTDQFDTFSYVWNLSPEKPTARSVLTVPVGVASATLGGRIELVANCAANVVVTTGSGRATKLVGAGFPLELPAGLPSISAANPVTIEMSFDPGAVAKRECRGQVQWDDAWVTPVA